MTEAETERAAVVAWLRNDADCFHPDVEIQILRVAAMIERGEHLTNEGK